MRSLFGLNLLIRKINTSFGNIQNNVALVRYHHHVDFGKTELRVLVASISIRLIADANAQVQFSCASRQVRRRSDCELRNIFCLFYSCGVLKWAIQRRYQGYLR